MRKLDEQAQQRGQAGNGIEMIIAAGTRSVDQSESRWDAVAGPVGDWSWPVRGALPPGDCLAYPLTESQGVVRIVWFSSVQSYPDRAAGLASASSSTGRNRSSDAWVSLPGIP
jgi:hypothetical protein